MKCLGAKFHSMSDQSGSWLDHRCHFLFETALSHFEPFWDVSWLLGLPMQLGPPSSLQQTQSVTRPISTLDWTFPVRILLTSPYLAVLHPPTFISFYIIFTFNHKFYSYQNIHFCFNTRPLLILVWLPGGLGDLSGMGVSGAEWRASTRSDHSGRSGW